MYVCMWGASQESAPPTPASPPFAGSRSVLLPSTPQDGQAAEKPAAIEQQILKTQALSRADHGGAPLPDASAVASPWQEENAAVTPYIGDAAEKDKVGSSRGELSSPNSPCSGVDTREYASSYEDETWSPQGSKGAGCFSICSPRLFQSLRKSRGGNVGSDKRGRDETDKETGKADVPAFLPRGMLEAAGAPGGQRPDISAPDSSPRQSDRLGACDAEPAAGQEQDGLLKQGAGPWPANSAGSVTASLSPPRIHLRANGNGAPPFDAADAGAQGVSVVRSLQPIPRPPKLPKGEKLKTVYI